MGANFCATVQKGELDEERHGDDLGLQGVEEADRGGGGATCRKEIVDQQDFLSRVDGVPVDFHRGLSVFKGVAGLPGLPGELAFLPDGDESGLETVSDRSGENEPAGVDADDLVDGRIAGSFRKEADGGLKEFSVREDGCDVFEDDTRLGKIGNIANGSTEGVGIGHGGDLLFPIGKVGKEEVVFRGLCVAFGFERVGGKFHLHEGVPGSMERPWRSGF